MDAQDDFAIAVALNFTALTDFWFAAKMRIGRWSQPLLRFSRERQALEGKPGNPRRRGEFVADLKRLVLVFWLALSGLSVGLKNDLDQASDLLSYFDWALDEECFYYQECSALTPFVSAGKAVFEVEYTDDGMTLAKFCQQADRLNFNSLLKRRNLGAWRQACRRADQARTLR